MRKQWYISVNIQYFVSSGGLELADFITLFANLFNHSFDFRRHFNLSSCYWFRLCCWPRFLALFTRVLLLDNESFVFSKNISAISRYWQHGTNPNQALILLWPHVQSQSIAEVSRSYVFHHLFTFSLPSFDFVFDPDVGIALVWPSGMENRMQGEGFPEWRLKTK